MSISLCHKNFQLLGHLKVTKQVIPSSWGPPLSPLSHFLGPLFPVVVPRCLAWLMLPTRSSIMRFPFLVCVSPPCLGLLPVLLLPPLLTVMMKLLFRVSHAVLRCSMHCFRVMVMLQLFSHAQGFLAFPPPSPLLLLALNLPRRLAAAANALSGVPTWEYQLASSFSSSSSHCDIILSSLY
jgi:hypothetical protein